MLPVCDSKDFSPRLLTPCTREPRVGHLGFSVQHCAPFLWDIYVNNMFKWSIWQMCFIRAPYQLGQVSRINPSLAQWTTWLSPPGSGPGNNVHLQETCPLLCEPLEHSSHEHSPSRNFLQGTKHWSPNYQSIRRKKRHFIKHLLLKKSG